MTAREVAAPRFFPNQDACHTHLHASLGFGRSTGLGDRSEMPAEPISRHRGPTTCPPARPVALPGKEEGWECVDPTAHSRPPLGGQNLRPKDHSADECTMLEQERNSLPHRQTGVARTAVPAHNERQDGLPRLDIFFTIRRLRCAGRSAPPPRPYRPRGSRPGRTAPTQSTAKRPLHAHPGHRRQP